jgi:hypothetical protein
MFSLFNPSSVVTLCSDFESAAMTKFYHLHFTPGIPHPTTV